MPENFLTTDILYTLPGQVLAVGLLTQVVKTLLPNLSKSIIRFVACLSGVGVHVTLTWNTASNPADYVLVIVNGLLVALAAMKGVEVAKETVKARKKQG